VASGKPLGFKVKKQVNDLLRRLTGYQFVKADTLDALEASAQEAKPTGQPGR
jgi:hypothetical protein